MFETVPLDYDGDNCYGFSKFACSLNDLATGEAQTLPPTDSRLRPDIRFLEFGEPIKASAAKFALEEV